MLTTTLLEYVAADFNTKVAAERLFVHPNTARYRLGKIEERTGCDLRHVADVLDLLIALRVHGEGSSSGCVPIGAVRRRGFGRAPGADENSPRLGEGADAGDVAADDQRLHRLGALVGVDDLDVAHVADDVVLEQDAVAAEQVARLGDHLARLARVVELGEPGDRVA